MRPMTETRKRRLSDPQLANKRLNNGLSKVDHDHVLTRSQAKNDPTPRVSPSRTVKQKRGLTTEERRLLISMRLRHEEKHTTQASINASQGHEENKRRHSKNSNKNQFVNGRANGLSSPVKTSVRSKLRSVNDLHSESNGRSIQETIKKTKRRSSLWVLNCEAESFLFGETAAEDQEVELPPITSPPKKRRRVRTTELGELLKETPLLGSKLRNAANGCCESEVSSETSDRPRGKPKRTDNNNKRRFSRTKNSSRVQRKLEMESSNSEAEVDDEDDSGSNLEFPDLSYTLMLEAAAAAANSSSSISQNDSSTSSEQSVRIKRILNSMEYSFSFENVPSSEVWYRTFLHQNRPRHTFHSPIRSSVILPYEAKAINRDLEKRLRRPPRKSPRCHASTQAILSALKPARGSRSAGVGPRPPSPSSSTPLPSTSSSKSKPINIASHIQETPVSSCPVHSLPTLGSQILFSSSTPSSHQQQPPLVAPNAISNCISACELTATQYLWDSIQFLSDPYVIHVLNQSDPRSTSKSRIRSPLNKMEKNSLEVSMGKSSGKRLGTIYVNHNNNIKSPLKLVIPSPKTSPGPRLSSGGTCSSPSPTSSPHSQNGNCSKLELRRVLRSPTASVSSPAGPSSPGSSPANALLPSPLLQSPTPGTVRKSTRKGSGLIVAAESKTFHVKHSSYTSTNLGSKFKSVSPKFSSFPVLPQPSPTDEALLTADNSLSLPDFPWDTFV